MDTKMTKARAIQLARRGRAHGYYRPSQTEAYVFCPSCRERVDTEFFPWAKIGEVVRALDAAMIEHVRYDCKETS